jgi:hypothetical protein
MQVNCPHCQTILDLSPFAPGTVIACANCQQHLTIPAPVHEPESVAVERLQRSYTTARRQRVFRFGRRNRRQRRAKARAEQWHIYGKLFTVCMLIVVPLGLFAIFNLMMPNKSSSSGSNLVREEAPPFSAIALCCANFTDAQWNVYQKSLVGKQVTNWSGTVVDVNETLLGDYEIWIDMDDPNDLFSIQDVYYPCSGKQALEFNKGTGIEFSGVIESVIDLLGNPKIYLK